MKKFISSFLLSTLILTGCSFNENSATRSKNPKEFKRASFLPEKARSLLNEGINKINVNNTTGAIEDFQDMTKIYPDLPIAYYNLGLAYAKDNKLNKAINSWEQAITLDNNYADAYYNLALAYKIMHNNNKTVENYTKYLSLKPDDPNKELIKKEINKFQEAYSGKGLLGRISMTDKTDTVNNIALETKSIFKPETSHIYTTMELINAPKNTDVKVGWYFLTSDKQKLPVNMLKFKAEGSKNILLTLKKPAATWPVGNYELDILINDELNSIVPFTVLR